MKGIHTKYGPYHGDYPQKPYEPQEPDRANYIGRGAIEKKPIYSDFEILREDVSEDDGEFWEGHGYEEEEIPKVPEIRMRSLTLQDLLDKLPPGAEPKDIVFDLSYPRYVDYIWVSFNHRERNLETEEASYKRDLETYQKNLLKYQDDLAKYQKDLADFQKWEKEHQVKELEEKLAKLKS